LHCRRIDRRLGYEFIHHEEWTRKHYVSKSKARRMNSSMYKSRQSTGFDPWVLVSTPALELILVQKFKEIIVGQDTWKFYEIWCSVSIH
jgi:hypothetical protein